jgi:hypothetical protein
METETLIAALDSHDELLRRVVAGRLSVVEFLAQYDNFYWAYALDGHEDAPAAAQLAALASRIAPHRRVAEEVLTALAPESLASQPTYIMAGRIGHTEALSRLRLIAGSLPAGGA